MRLHMVFFGIGLVACTAACMGDSIRFDGNTYDTVYIAESGTHYFVCFPEDGTLRTVVKSSVAQGDVSILEDRDARRSLYERWVAKRESLRGYSRVSVEPASQDSSPEGASSGAGDAESSEGEKHVTRVSRPPVYNSSGQYAADTSQEDLSKRRRQAAIEAQRRQREAAKTQLLMNRRVYTSEDAKGGSVQWNNGGGQSGTYNY